MQLMLPPQTVVAVCDALRLLVVGSHSAGRQLMTSGPCSWPSIASRVRKVSSNDMSSTWQ